MWSHPSRTLERRTGVELLHLPDGRALISFDQTTTIAALELLIKDALEDAELPGEDREVFVAIDDILKTARRSDRVSMLQRNVIVLETAVPGAQTEGNVSEASLLVFVAVAAAGPASPAAAARRPSRRPRRRPSPRR